MAPASLQSRSQVSQCQDFTRCLPLQLSLYILGFLDEKSLSACSDVNSHWAFLAGAVKEERECRATVQQDFLQLKELCPRKTIPNYAKRVTVQIPQLNEKGDVTEEKGNNLKRRKSSKTEEVSLQAAYRNLKTNNIQLEERNVFCGSYNTRVLMAQSDNRRMIHYSGGSLVAVASANQRVRLLGVPAGKEVPALLYGHAGSTRALHLSEEKGLLLTADLDLSIRCWNIHSGACMKSFNGHYGTITCLDLHKEQFVSGAGDGMVKVWSLKSGKCLKTLMHNSAVWAVKMDGTHVVSGCEQGLVKVWCADTGALIKTLEKHQGPVSCLSFDQWHLLTGGSDGFVLGWSMLGNLRKQLMAFFHPKAVLSLEFLYLRVISGCADGKIRVFNFLSGTCLNVLVVSSSGDPVSSLHVAENRMVINSPARVLMFQFQDVTWDYSLPADREVKEKEKEKQPKGKSSRSPTRQQKMRSQSAKGRGTSKSPPRELKKSAACQQPDGEPEHSPSLPAPAQPDEAEDTLQPVKRRSPSHPMSPSKLLLTISTLQNTSKPALVSSSTEHSAKARESWKCPREHQQQGPEKVPMSKTSLQHKKDQTEQLQRARLHSDSLTMKTISTPFETKMLRLKLKNSLHSPSVKSSIPAPCVVRPKALLGENKVPGGHGKAVPLPRDRVQFTDLCTASSELIKPTPVRNEVSRRIKPSRSYNPDPFRRDGGFRLLTAKQACEAAAAAQCQAQHTEPTGDQERARQKAWLRKVKGLPVDSFTGEGKTPVPELGYNVWV
ncbi:PREDICTED: F-box/WD repeat-containing protein 10-like isoform X1 [Lepidothrix coronata]|uniref:F-box/WD repeat-containing protein 10-like isoform X1 n=2 Tax=Lepidothrix coronata TaxID=321398 RepID=A0A6J0J6Q7_9PASS|nr:PREDICTED: F-box/WD repeat-containing protein 10-like isoform X1 [Lepidothrix coronata]XP_017694608.1 PREDICTED: F-box/WD repeat-containing protein 10-like isoform X1 [Lepidothrix coronata]XP_017694609.1 PREDICTED: F-box/WD repeat-containing protein 10-like isoform X1 [Lepidothrix coronata]XP_017694614.1 PREDICTED: F-box/WD repeat-containing protein 10-like isoform X1 [Lepidothrix coronata]